MLYVLSVRRFLTKKLSRFGREEKLSTYPSVVWWIFLQETLIFDGKIHGFLQSCPTNQPTQWW